MPRKRKAGKHYFTKDHENAIVRYSITNCKKERTDLYVNWIQPAFNEMVDKIVLKQVHEALTALSIPIQDMPCFEQGAEAWKLSAAWLMDRAGFGKGFGDGAAGLSTNHCLAIVNRGDAQASDIAELAREIQEGVLKRFGVTLAPEPVYLGGFI